MSEVRRRKVEEAGDDGATDAATTNVSANTSDGEKRNSSAADSSDHVSSCSLQ